MLFKCAVSIAVSCLPLGELSIARVRLTNALESQFARDASVLSVLLMHHCLSSLQRSKSFVVGVVIKEWKPPAEYMPLTETEQYLSTEE